MKVMVVTVVGVGYMLVCELEAIRVDHRVEEPVDILQHPLVLHHTRNNLF